MIKTIKITTGLLSVNSYILINDDTLEGVIIDSGENYELIKKTENEYGYKLKAVLLTHAHFDHSGNCKKLQNDGVKIYISEKDKEKLSNEANMGKAVRGRFDYLVPDFTFFEGDLSLYGINLKVLETPGHTDGSCCFILNNSIFSGDTLFYDSYGRTDFVSGDYNEIKKSIKRLFSLKGDYEVFPGHGNSTTLSREREFNMIVGDL